MASIIARIRSRIRSSSVAFPTAPTLLSLSMASSSGTRRPAGVSCGSTRRILTPFHFSTNFAILPSVDCLCELLEFCPKQPFNRNIYPVAPKRGHTVQHHCHECSSTPYQCTKCPERLYGKQGVGGANCCYCVQERIGVCN